MGSILQSNRVCVSFFLASVATVAAPKRSLGLAVFVLVVFSCFLHHWVVLIQIFPTICGNCRNYGMIQLNVKHARRLETRTFDRERGREETESERLKERGREQK